MKSRIFFLTFITSLIFVITANDNCEIFGLSNSELLICSKENWVAFKRTHKKEYKNKSDHCKRYQNWCDAMLYVSRTNANSDNTFTVSINSFADWSSEEQNRLKINKPKDHKRKILKENDMKKRALPLSVDWTKKGAVTPIKNQGNCSSCWAFAAIGALEGAYFVKYGVLKSFSQQFLVDCDSYDAGCTAGWPDNAFYYISSKRYIPLDSFYPYTANTANCTQVDLSTVVNMNVSFYNFAKTESALMIAVYKQPVSAVIDANHISFLYYSSGIYNDVTCSQTNPNHAILIVGYGTENNQDYWLVKNSWGTGWGLNGYIKMARNKNNLCGIANYASFPILT